MRNSTRALLWVLLVFLIGTLFGAAVVRLSLRSRLGADGTRGGEARVESPTLQPPAPTERSDPNPPPIRPPAPAGDFQPGALREMLQHLAMSAEQEEQARQILERARSEYAAVEMRRNQAQRRIRQQALRNLRDILNPGQRRQLRQYLSELQQRRRRQGN